MPHLFCRTELGHFTHAELNPAPRSLPGEQWLHTRKQHHFTANRTTTTTTTTLPPGPSLHILLKNDDIDTKEWKSNIDFHFFFFKLGNSFYWHFAKVKTLSWKTFPEKHYNDHILKTWMQWTVPTFPSCFPSSVRMSTQVSESEGIWKKNKSILPQTSTTGSTIIGTKASDSPVQWGVPVHWKHME